MPTVSLKSQDDVEAFVTGLAFYGTGGGGDPLCGRSMLEREIGAACPVGWVDPSEVDPEAWCVRVSVSGTIAPPSDAELALRSLLGMKEENRIYYHVADAARALAEMAGVEVGAILPPELGGSNTCIALMVGAHLGIPVLDADCAGRAIPELSIALPAVSGRAVWPLVTVDPWGNVCVVRRALSASVAERMIRHLAVASFGNTGVAGFLMKVRDVLSVCLSGTLTRSLEVGRAIRQARSSGVDVADAVAQVTGGWVVFRGEVVQTNGDNRDGFYWGEHVVAGEGCWARHTLRICFKNENLVSWIDGEPYVTAPDLISLIDRRTGLPLTNMHVRSGQKVAVIGIRASDAYRTPQGIASLGPQHFGFDMPYRPIEEVLGLTREW